MLPLRDKILPGYNAGTVPSNYFFTKINDVSLLGIKKAILAYLSIYDEVTFTIKRKPKFYQASIKGRKLEGGER